MSVNTLKIISRDLGKEKNTIWPQVIAFRESIVGGGGAGNKKGKCFQSRSIHCSKKSFHLSHIFAAKGRTLSKFNFVCTYRNK